MLQLRSDLIVTAVLRYGEGALLGGVLRDYREQVPMVSMLLFAWDNLYFRRLWRNG